MRPTMFLTIGATRPTVGNATGQVVAQLFSRIVASSGREPSVLVSAKPKIAWVGSVWSREFQGRGVRDAANPPPIAGCMTGKGASAATIPTASAGARVGLSSHAVPWVATRIAANAMPARQCAVQPSGRAARRRSR